MKSPCGKGHSTPKETRALLAAMYDKLCKEGRQDYAQQSLQAQRLAKCVHASECKRLCARLVKGPGISQVACVEIETGRQRPLYEALEDPAFECPDGLF